MDEFIVMSFIMIFVFAMCKSIKFELIDINGILVRHSLSNICMVSEKKKQQCYESGGEEEEEKNT